MKRNTHKFRILLLLLICALPTLGLAATKACRNAFSEGLSAFKQGRDLYQHKHYDVASSLFGRAISRFRHAGKICSGVNTQRAKVNRSEATCHYNVAKGLYYINKAYSKRNSGHRLSAQQHYASAAFHFNMASSYCRSPKNRNVAKNLLVKTNEMIAYLRH